MSAATLLLAELDTEASALGAASKRIRLALYKSHVAAIGAVGCFNLHRAQRSAAKIRVSLSGSKIETAEERALLRDVASNLGQASAALSQTHDRMKMLGVGKWPIFGRTILRQLEDLACTVEDMSETAALGASEAFAATARRRAQSGIDARQKQYQTA